MPRPSGLPRAWTSNGRRRGVDDDLAGRTGTVEGVEGEPVPGDLDEKRLTRRLGRRDLAREVRGALRRAVSQG
jgi:hypothetical protein